MIMDIDLWHNFVHAPFSYGYRPIDDVRIRKFGIKINGTSVVNFKEKKNEAKRKKRSQIVSAHLT